MMCETCSDPEKHALETEVERLRALVANYEFHFKGDEAWEHLRKQADENGYMVLARDRELDRLRNTPVWDENFRLREEKDAGWQAYEYAKARLHRIEEAARAYVEWANVIEPTEPFAALRAALEGQ